MPNRSPHRPLLLLCDAEVAAELRSALPPTWRDEDTAIDWASPNLSQQPLLWLDPPALLPPGPTADEDARDLWGRTIHLIAERLLVRVHRLSAESDIDGLLAWHTQYLESVLPRIQSHVRNYAAVAVLIFSGWEPTPAQFDRLRPLWALHNQSRPSTDTVYVMMPELRVDPASMFLIHARHVWPKAVARLLLRLGLEGQHGQRGRGLHAWRSFELRAQIDPKVEQRIVEEEQAAFLDLFTRSGSIQEPVPVDELLSPGRLVPEAESPAERALRLFLPRRDQHALDSVQDLLNPRQLEARLEQLGGKFRHDRAVRLADHAGRTERRIRDWWQWVHRWPIPLTDQEPAPGGPGLLGEMVRCLAVWKGQLRLGERLETQARAWEDCLTADRDFDREKRVAEAKARQLDFARNAFVDAWARVALSLIAAVVLGFGVALAVDVWAGFWSNPAGGRELKKGLLLAAALLACVAGCTAGALVPYWVERYRGRYAGNRLAQEVRALLAALFERANRRVTLCLQGEVTGLAAAAAAAAEHGQRVADRAYLTILPVLGDHLAAVKAALTGRADPREHSPDASSPIAPDAGDSPAHPDPEPDQASPRTLPARNQLTETARAAFDLHTTHYCQLDTAPETENQLSGHARTALYEQAQKRWDRICRRFDPQARGWFPHSPTQQAVAALCSDMAQEIRTTLRAFAAQHLGDPTQARPAAARAALDRWLARPNIRGLPLLSCQIEDPPGNVRDLSTFVLAGLPPWRAVLDRWVDRPSRFEFEAWLDDGAGLLAFVHEEFAIRPETREGRLTFLPATLPVPPAPSTS